LHPINGLHRLRIAYVPHNTFLPCSQKVEGIPKLSDLCPFPESDLCHLSVWPAVTFLVYDNTHCELLPDPLSSGYKKACFIYLPANVLEREIVKARERRATSHLPEISSSSFGSPTSKELSEKNPYRYSLWMPRGPAASVPVAWPPPRQQTVT
ncbi:hypothetical protein EWB00_000468, partial [Schistosoma japonicum]